jgi:molybdate transport system ATP-binding protein
VTSGLSARLRVPRSPEFTLDAAFDAVPGQTVAMLGPSGAGKSTAVAALAGLIAIEAGVIELGGTVLDDPERGVFVPPEDRRVGVVFQDYVLFPHLDAEENVAFGLRSRGVGRDEAHRRAREWLARFGLEGLRGQRPGELSGGQAQRTALARALITEPDLLLLDEPLSALDVATRARLRRTLADHLSGFPGPRILITHDPLEAFLLADEVLVIENGSITQAGTADDLRLRPRTAYAAEVAGTNLFAGTAAGGLVTVGDHTLHVADTRIEGSVLVAIRATAVSLHRNEPEGSPRNTWTTTVEVIERLGDRVRIRTGPPLSLAVEITEEAALALNLRGGAEIWLAVKATEMNVEADDPS